MKPGTTSKPFPSKPDEIEAAIQAAPERVQDPETPYDPNDRAAAEAFWKKATTAGTRSFPFLFKTQG